MSVIAVMIITISQTLLVCGVCVAFVVSVSDTFEHSLNTGIKFSIDEHCNKIKHLFGNYIPFLTLDDKSSPSV